MSFTLTQLQDAIKDYTENQETTFVNNLNIFNIVEIWWIS